MGLKLERFSRYYGCKVSWSWGSKEVIGSFGKLSSLGSNWSEMTKHYSKKKEKYPQKFKVTIVTRGKTGKWECGSMPNTLMPLNMKPYNCIWKAKIQERGRRKWIHQRKDRTWTGAATKGENGLGCSYGHSFKPEY